jgi:hypothetical protein
MTESTHHGTHHVPRPACFRVVLPCFEVVEVPLQDFKKFSQNFRCLGMSRIIAILLQAWACSASPLNVVLWRSSGDKFSLPAARLATKVLNAQLAFNLSIVDFEVAFRGWLNLFRFLSSSLCCRFRTIQFAYSSSTPKRES